MVLMPHLSWVLSFFQIYRLRMPLKSQCNLSESAASWHVWVLCRRRRSCLMVVSIRHIWALHPGCFRLKLKFLAPQVFQLNWNLPLGGSEVDPGCYAAARGPGYLVVAVACGDQVLGDWWGPFFNPSAANGQEVTTHNLWPHWPPRHAG